MKTALPFAALSLLALTACGGGGEAQQNASQQLEDAAEVSNPAAANILESAAENGTNAQDALQQAGNVQAGLPAGNGQTGGAAETNAH